jgi:hypothetical protein
LMIHNTHSWRRAEGAKADKQLNYLTGVSRLMHHNRTEVDKVGEKPRIIRFRKKGSGWPRSGLLRGINNFE